MTESKEIRTLGQLCDYFSAEAPILLNKRIYKGTECGASISLQTPDGEWHHNGDNWEGITEIVAFTIQTIVEGSDATVDSEPFVLPVPEKAVEDWIDEMEMEAKRLWRRDNAVYYTVLKDGGEIFMCRWVDWDDEPEGDYEPEQLPLAKAAYEAINDPQANPLMREGYRTIDYHTLIPIPGHEGYFVCEDEDWGED